jgi:MFS family permease
MPRDESRQPVQSISISNTSIESLATVKPAMTKGSTRSLRHSVRVLCGSFDLMKAVLAASLLAVGTILSPINVLVISELKNQFWGHHMSAYSAAVNLANGLVGLACSGLFGRFGDKVSRKAAMTAVGILGFLPGWFLLMLGQNATALVVYSIFQVIGGAACITVTGCPTCYALVSDVMPKDEREVAFGFCFAALILIGIFANFWAFLIQTLVKDSTESRQIVLWGSFLLNLMYFACVYWIRIPAEKQIEVEVSKATIEDGVSVEPDNQHSPKELVVPRSVEAQGLYGRFCHILMSPMRLVCEHPPLRNLCIITGLVCLPEVTLQDITTQYIFASFGLIGSDEASKLAELQVLGNFPGFLLLLPGFCVVGLVGKKIGSRSLLIILLPVTAVLLCLPVLLRFLPELWLVPIVGIGVPFSMVLLSPLQTLVTEVSPPDRIGEAMGAVGASKQVSGLLSNILVTFVTPALMSSRVENPLWIFYPLASLFSILALVFALRVHTEKVDPPELPKEELNAELDQGAKTPH